MLRGRSERLLRSRYAITRIYGRVPLSRGGVRIPHDGYESLLGPYPNERMYQVCQKVLRTAPGYLPCTTSLDEAYTALVSTVFEATKKIACTCNPHEACLTSPGWMESRNQAKRTCKINRVWTAIGSCLHYGFARLFINASDNVTMTHPSSKIGYQSIANYITDQLKAKVKWGSCDELREIVTSLICPMYSKNVAASSTSSTLYLTALCTLALPREMNGQYSLSEGRLIHNGQYHNSLRHIEVGSRPLAKKSLQNRKLAITPSCSGNILIL